MKATFSGCLKHRYISPLRRIADSTPFCRRYRNDPPCSRLRSRPQTAELKRGNRVEFLKPPAEMEFVIKAQISGNFPDSHVGIVPEVAAGSLKLDLHLVLAGRFAIQATEPVAQRAFGKEQLLRKLCRGEKTVRRSLYEAQHLLHQMFSASPVGIGAFGQFAEKQPAQAGQLFRLQAGGRPVNLDDFFKQRPHLGTLPAVDKGAQHSLPCLGGNPAAGEAHVKVHGPGVVRAGDPTIVMPPGFQ